MDSIELNKIAAAIACAGVALVAADRIGAGLAAVRPPAEPAFAIAAAAPGAAPAARPFAALLRTASAAHGEAYAAAQCSACHGFAAGGPAIVGPNLYGVADRAVGGQQDYDYSDALHRLGGRWTPERLDSWLARPATFAPGTRMGFVGIADPGTRADVVAFLLTLSTPAAAATPRTATPPAATPPAATPPAATPSTMAPPAATPGTATPAAASPPSATPAAATAPAPDRIKAGQAIAEAQCSACHSFDKNGAAVIGPNLYGVVGRPIAGDASYAYSAALSAHHGPWTEAALDAWLLKPRTYAPGTKMGYPGLAADGDRAAVIAYLRSLSDRP